MDRPATERTRWAPTGSSSPCRTSGRSPRLSAWRWGTDVRPLLTADEARRWEGEAEARGATVETLMERAGYAVARTTAQLAGGAYGRRAVVVCGKGNNAGDGFV